MKKKIIVSIIMTIVLMCYSFAYCETTVPAADTTTLSNFWSNALGFMTTGSQGANGQFNNQDAAEGQLAGGMIMETIFKAVLPLLFTVMNSVFVIVTLVLGIKFMLAGADGKAEIKQKLVPFIVATILGFSVVAFYNIILELIQGLFGIAPS